VRLKEHLLASHTTTEQVGKIATAAKVKTLVLSHPGPRRVSFYQGQGMAGGGAALLRGEDCGGARFDGDIGVAAVVVRC
jgi:hypothetical protein